MRMQNKIYSLQDPECPVSKCLACEGTGRIFVSKKDFNEMIFTWCYAGESDEFIKQKRTEYLKDHCVTCGSCQGRGES